jgi:hypothetical protein
MVNSKFVAVVSVTDPDTNLPVEIEIRKLETGAMIGLDGSYLEQLGDDEQPNNPYCEGKILVPLDEKVNN